LLKLELAEMKKVLQIAFFVLLAVAGSHQRSDGAPASRCENLTPNHQGSVTQEGIFPYEILPSATVIGNGQRMLVEITSPERDLAFRGFLMQARASSDPLEIVGEFVESEAYNIRNCSDLFASSATNANANDKNSLVLEWIAPSDFTGTVKFQ